MYHSSNGLESFRWILWLYLSANDLGICLQWRLQRMHTKAALPPLEGVACRARVVLGAITFDTALDAGDLRCSLSSGRPNHRPTVGRNLDCRDCAGRLALRR